MPGFRCNTCMDMTGPHLQPCHDCTHAPVVPLVWHGVPPGHLPYHLKDAKEILAHAQLKPGALVLDIGAHIGTLSVLAAKQGATVVALEPDVDNFSALLKNVHANGVWGKVIPIPCAVTTKSFETVTLYGGPSAGLNQGQNSLAFDPARFSTRIGKQTPTLSFKSAVELAESEDFRRIDLIKMDIEGGEWEILREAGDEDHFSAWFTNVRAIDIELHEMSNDQFFTEEQRKAAGWTKDSTSKLRAWFESLGFVLTWNRENDPTVIRGRKP